MTIYTVADFINNTTTWFVPDQATIDQVSTMTFISASLIIGTQADADALLATNQRALLTMQLPYFGVCRGTPTGDPDAPYAWSACDLSTEATDGSNDSTPYKMRNVPHGDLIRTVGLTSATNLLSQLQQTYIEYVMLDQAYPMDSLPPFPPPPPPLPAPKAKTTSTSTST